MKVRVLPDIHLKPYIFTRAKELLNAGGADMAVCLMELNRILVPDNSIQYV